MIKAGDLWKAYKSLLHVTIYLTHHWEIIGSSMSGSDMYLASSCVWKLQWHIFGGFTKKEFSNTTLMGPLVSTYVRKQLQHRGSIDSGFYQLSGLPALNLKWREKCVQKRLSNFLSSNRGCNWKMSGSDFIVNFIFIWTEAHSTIPSRFLACRISPRWEAETCQPVT